MRRLLLLLAALALAPAALAQGAVSTALHRIDLTAPRVAPGDTTLLINVPDTTTRVSTWEFGLGSGDFLFGTNSVDIRAFGSGFTLPDDGADYELIGATFFATNVPATGDESFVVNVFDGTLEDGPVGEAIYSQTYSSDIIPAVENNTISRTFMYFDEPVTAGGPVVFITFDVAGITSELSIGATGDLNVPAPETIIFIPPDAQGQDPPVWAPVEQVVTLNADGTDVLETFLFAEAILREGGAEFVVRPIAQARGEGEGATVTVEGVVTRAEGAFVYIQDETGGLTIRQTSGELFDAVESGALPRGAVLRVTGTLSQFNNLLQINGADLVASAGVGSAEVPAPQTVTLDEIAQNGEDYEGELVRVEGVSFDTPPAQFAAATSYAVTDGSGTGVVRVPNAGDTEIDGTDFIGSPATITGIVTQFSASDPAAGYQILVLTAGDVGAAAVAAERGLDGAFGLSAPSPNPAGSSAEVVVRLAAPGRAVVAVYDALGREVARALDRDLRAGDHPVRIGLDGLAAGTYVVRLTTAAGVASTRLSVAR